MSWILLNELHRLGRRRRQPLVVLVLVQDNDHPPLIPRLEKLLDQFVVVRVHCKHGEAEQLFT